MYSRPHEQEVSGAMRADPGASQVDRSYIGGGRTPRAPLVVLILDPDPQRAEVLAQVLRSTCVVAIVSTARAAAAAIRTQVPDLLVTDLDLPDTSGMGFLTSLHSAVPTRDTLLMVITGRTALTDKIAAFQAGADDYLVRPVDPERFLLRVRLLSRFRRHFPQ